MNRIPGRALAGAALAFAAALVVFVSALGRALAPVDAGAAPVGVPGSEPADSASAPRPPLGADALMLAVENDPFSPGRTRPGQRYRLPGDVDPPPPPEPPPPPPLPDFRVSGTVVTPDGGLAVIRIGDGASRVLSIGDYLGGYRLERVTAETATLRNDERELTLLVPGPAAQPMASAAPQPQRGAGRGPGMMGRQQQNPREQAARAELLEALLARARADGATPQQLQAIQRMVEQRGIENMGNVEVQIQGGTMTLRTRTSPPDTSSTSRPPRR